MKTASLSLLFLPCFCILAAADEAKPTAAKEKQAAKAKETKSNSAELAAKAQAVLERNCLRCHRGKGSPSGLEFDVRDTKSLIDKGVVDAENPKEDSPLWQRVHRGTMPPPGQIQLPRPTPEDAQFIADWIAGGAPAFPPVKRRKPIPLKDALEAIKDDLDVLNKKSGQNVCAHQRYFSLLEWYNNPNIRDETLQLARAALSKALNSLSWEQDIVEPRSIDANQTVFAVDIEKLGWDRRHWQGIRAHYPYAVGFDRLEDHTLRDLDAAVRKVADNGEPLYLVRADWFVATATQPPLYYTLLYDLYLPELQGRLPDARQPANPRHMTSSDLEHNLQIDVIDNIRRGRDFAQRSGFTSSGVSAQNRAIERHKIKRYKGYYWISYDFKPDGSRSILSQFPLGPPFPGNRFPKLAFEQAGGEIIFSLPNGLQGYLLIDGEGNRIDAGPINVVSDSLKTSGTPAIVSGLSCMACHKLGLIEGPPDEIRSFARVVTDAKDQVENLYPPADEFAAKVKADGEEYYLKALKQAVESILRQGKDAERELTDFPEPVSEVARIYLIEEMDLASAAAEVYEPNVDQLRTKLKESTLLKDLGLSVLLRESGTIKRAFWESSQGGSSVMQLTAFTFGYTPSSNKTTP